MKIAFRIFISLFIVTMAFYACKEEDLSGDLLKPWKAPETVLNADVTVGAYYNLSFNDTNWLAIDALYLPELGKYNSTNQTVLQQHVDWALQSGIDFLIYPHSRFADSMIVNVFPGITGMENIKMVLDLSFSTPTAPMNLTDSASVQRIIADFKSMQVVFDRPNYLKIDGKPLVVLQGVYGYQPVPATGVTTDERVAAMEALRAMLKDSTGLDYYFVANYVGFSPPDRYPEYVQTFDALTSNMFTDQKALSNSLNENIDLSWEHWKSYLESWSVSFVPAIFPGRNDTIRPTSHADVLPRSEQFFTDQCKLAKYYLDEDLRIIIIDSFNDWNYGTQVEPADNYGNAYLDVVKKELTVN